jgi:hypothetical protein
LICLRLWRGEVPVGGEDADKASGVVLLLLFCTGKRSDEVVDDVALMRCACCSDRGSGSEIST